MQFTAPCFQQNKLPEDYEARRPKQEVPELRGCGCHSGFARESSVCCIENSAGVWQFVSAPMPVARRLEDRIRSLCAKSVAAGLGELNPILSELKTALH